MEVRYQLRYSPVNRIYVRPETRDSIPAASPSSHQPGSGRQARDLPPTLCGRREHSGGFLIKMALPLCPSSWPRSYCCSSNGLTELGKRSLAPPV